MQLPARRREEHLLRLILPGPRGRIRPGAEEARRRMNLADACEGFLRGAHAFERLYKLLREIAADRVVEDLEWVGSGLLREWRQA